MSGSTNSGFSLMAYTKLFSHIITSTIWDEDDQTRILWITMLALSNKFGEVMASVPGLAHTARLSAEATRKALACLEAPDPDSRTPDEEGRRVIKIDGGWHIINYEKHRRMASLDERREQARIRKQRQRKRKKDPSDPPDVTLDVTQSHTRSRLVTLFDDNAEAEAKAEYKEVPESTEIAQNGSYPESTKKSIEPPLHPSSGGDGTESKKKRKRQPPKPDPDFDRFWAELPVRNRIGKKRALEAWHRAVEDGATAEQIIDGVYQYKKAERKRAHQDDYRPLHPTTWLNQGRWDDGEEIEVEKPYNPWA